MVDQFHQTAMGDIQSCNKLKLYGQLKTELGPEKYLSIPNIKHRQALTRLRLCSHSLTIETGRHKKIPPGERTCPLCKTGVEDEVHFLIKCPALDGVRSRYPEVAAIIKQPQNDSNKTLAMLSQGEGLHTMAKFIHEAFDFRDTMIETQSVLNDMITRVVSWEEKSRKQGEVRSKKLEAEVRKAALEKKKEQKNNDNKVKQLMHITNNLQNIMKQLIEL